MAITPEMSLGEILKSHPEVRGVFEQRFGPGCFTCPGSRLEDLRFAASMHNLDVEPLVEELNAVADGRLPAPPCTVPEDSAPAEDPYRAGEGMPVHPAYNVAALLKDYPESREVLVSHGFAPLASPIMGRIFAPLVTLAGAARLHRMTEEAFTKMIQDLNRLAGQEAGKQKV